MRKTFGIISAIGGLVFVLVVINLFTNLIQEFFGLFGCGTECTIVIGIIAVFAFGIFWWLAASKGK